MGKYKKIKYSLVFNRKGELNRDGEGLIQIKAYQDRKSKYFSTEVYIEPKFWDSRNKKVRYNHPNQFVYNQQIHDQLTAMEAFEIRMINRIGGLPLERLYEYRNDHTGDEPLDFTTFFKEELKHHQVKPSSRKMYQQTFNKLKEFRKTIYFEDVNYSLACDFDRFLHQKGLRINSIKKHHHRLKTFILQAIKKGLLPLDKNPYLSFKVKSEEPDRVFLTEEELEKIERIRFRKHEDRIERIKDIFLIAVYTGLRFSDVTNLTASKITQTVNGLVLTLKAEKTGKALILPLYALFQVKGARVSKPEEIIYKYLHWVDGLDAPEEAEKIPFFRITNQYMNRALKVLAVRAGIRKEITSHVARRTFATIMATKVKTPVLQRLLQHSRPDMTNIYVQLSNRVIENELKKIDWQ